MYLICSECNGLILVIRGIRSLCGIGVLARGIMVFLSISVDEPVVTSVSPSTGGIGGGFKLTVFGQSKFY